MNAFNANAHPAAMQPENELHKNENKTPPKKKPRKKEKKRKADGICDSAAAPTVRALRECVHLEGPAR